MQFFKRFFGGKKSELNSTNLQPPLARHPKAPNDPPKAQILQPHQEDDFRLLDKLDQAFRFVALDVETANSDPSSICQIGLAFVDHSDGIKSTSLLIDPEDGFDDFNSDLHGIDETKVAGEPTFAEAVQVLRAFLERNTLVQHSSFDKRAFDGACNRYGLPKLRATWIDSVSISQRAWPELKGNGGHGLANLKDFLNLDFQHHDAGEDANAAAQVVLMAENHTGKTFAELTAPRAKTPKSFEPSVAVEGNQSGPLYGHVACFTGKLSLSRVEASTYAAGAGITVRASISKKITLLVVGDQDITLLAGHTKSSKHRRAEELIDQGQEIRIIGETEFLGLIGKNT